MLTIITIVMLGMLVMSLNSALLKRPLRDRVHDRYYPFPSYSRKTYYRKIAFSDENLITVHDNFRRVQVIEKRPLQTGDKSPFSAVVQSVVARKAPLRIAECKTIPGVLVYADNIQSPTHVFCTGRPVSEIIGTRACDIESELDLISRNIVEGKKWSLNQVGLVLQMINQRYLPCIVWGKHGDYIVGWDRVTPVILARIGDDVRDKLAAFYAKNPSLCSIAEGEWGMRLFLCKIDRKSMYMTVKYRTPKSTFVVRFRKSLSILGNKSYAALNGDEKVLVDKTVQKVCEKRKVPCTELVDKPCFEKELEQFLQNLKEFVSDGTRFELS